MGTTSGNDQNVTFTGVHIFRSTHVIVRSVIDEYADEQRDHALVFHRRNGRWGHQIIDNSIAGVCVVDGNPPKVLHLGIDGVVAVSTLPGKTVEYVDQSPDGPNRSSYLRCMRRIGENVYAAGLARQVYKRSANGMWQRLDDGIFVPRDQRTESVGLNAIDGYSESVIYAVGYKGEIWHFNGSQWQPIDSPTNVALTTVKCCSGNNVFIGGVAGTLLRGNTTGWSLLPQPNIRSDIWGIAEFRNQVYVSSREGLFVLRNDGILARVEMGLDCQPSTAYVDANDGLLWSVGHNDIVSTVDGTVWTLLDKP